MHQPPAYRIKAVLSIIFLFFTGYFALPFAALILGSYQFMSIGNALWIIHCCMLPFLGTRPPNPMDGEYDQVTILITCTIIQWVVLALFNLAVISSGISKRPFFSALILVAISTCLSWLAIKFLGLRFETIHI